MKFATMLTAAAMAVAAANAAECSMSEMSDLMLKPETLALTTACASLNIDPTKSDDSKIKQICASSTCFAAVEKFTNILPVCTYQDISLSDRYKQIVADCKGASTSSSAAPVSATTTALTVAAALAAFARA